jgi:serine/threonine-protein kinase
VFAEKARAQFQQAIDLDPAFAEAWAGLGDAYKVYDYLALLPSEEAAPRSRAAAERALGLDPELAAAHAALATVLFDNYYDPRAAGQHYRRAIELNPNYATGHQLYAEYLRDMGRFDQALEAINKAQQLDPLSPFYLMIEGIIYQMARRPEEAVKRYRQLISAHPDYVAVHFYLALAYNDLKQYDAALHELALVDPQHTFPDAQGIRGAVFAQQGRFDEAGEVLKKLEHLSEVRYVSPFLRAGIYLALGEKGRSLDLLEQSVAERSWFVRLFKVNPGLDPFRAHPRFEALLKQVGLAD